MEDIRNWFNGIRNYEAGIKLYVAHGRDQKLKDLFTTEGFSDFKKKKLASALEELLISPKKHPAVEKRPAVKTSTKKTSAPVEVVPIEKRWRKERDEVEQSLWLQWKTVFLEMQNLVSRVGAVARSGDKTTACKMALQILDLDDQCDALYQKRDHYQEHKRLPEEKQPMEISQDPMLWPKMLTNHQRYAREFKKKLEKDAANTSAASHLQKHEWAVGEYKKLLKMD